MGALIDRWRTTRPSRHQAWIPAIVRVATGLFFVTVAIGKFVDYSREVHDFRGYEVPWPEVAVPAVGIVELVGGLLLIVGLLTRPTAVILALNMIGALATAGRVKGGSFHLVYAPLLLLLMVFLVWAGPGRPSIDEQLLDARKAGPSRQ